MLLQSIVPVFASPVTEILFLQRAVHTVSRRDKWQSIDLFCDKTSAARYLYIFIIVL